MGCPDGEGYDAIFLERKVKQEGSKKEYDTHRTPWC